MAAGYMVVVYFFALAGRLFYFTDFLTYAAHCGDQRDRYSYWSVLFSAALILSASSALKFSIAITLRFDLQLGHTGV